MSASRLGWCVVLAAVAVCLVAVDEASAQSAYYNSLWRSYRYGVPYYSYYDPYYYSYYYPWYYYDPTATTTTSSSTGPIVGPNQTPLTTTAQRQSAKVYMSGEPTKCILYTGASNMGFTPAARVHEAPKTSSDNQNTYQQQINTLNQQQGGGGNRTGTTWNYFGTQIVGADISYWQALNPRSNRGRGAPPDDGSMQAQTASGVINYTPGAEVQSRYETPSYAYSRFADPRRSLPEAGKAEPKQVAASDDAGTTDTADKGRQTATNTKAATGSGGNGGSRIVTASDIRTVRPASVPTVQANVGAANIRTIQPNITPAGDFRSRSRRGR